MRFALRNASDTTGADPDLFCKLAGKYGEKKARGTDHWKISELVAFPPPARRLLGDLLAKVDRFGVWPLQLLWVLVALIPKASGGERGIAKTPLRYRIWSIKKAGNQNVGICDRELLGQCLARRVCSQSRLP